MSYPIRIRLIIRITILLTILCHLKSVSGARGIFFFESKVDVEAGVNSCYYHHLSSKRLFLVEFSTVEVENGRMGEVGFEVYVNETQVMNIPSADTKVYEDESLKGGVYKFCFNNEADKVHNKHVNLYISFYKYVEYDEMVDEFTELEVHTELFKEMLTRTENNMKSLIHMSHVSKTFEARDFALAEGVGKYVSYWSAIHCFVIMVFAAVQVYFIRRLFDSEHTGKTNFWFWLTE